MKYGLDSSVPVFVTIVQQVSQRQVRFPVGLIGD